MAGTPIIEVSSPRALQAGSTARLKVRLRYDEPGKVDAVYVTLQGRLTWSLDGTHRSRGFFSSRTCVFEEHRVLDVGAHELDVDIVVPEGLPGSYTGRGLSIAWQVTVLVDIPWRIDASATFPVYVLGQEEKPPESRAVFVSDRHGPRAGEPYAELSLGSQRLEPGGELLARLALSNVGARARAQVRVTLVARESALWTESVDVARCDETVDMSGLDDGESRSVSMALPDSIQPGFWMMRASLEWFVHVTIPDPLAPRPLVAAPVCVGSGGGDATTPLPLAVGSDRLALAWRHVADQTGFDFADGRLQRLVDGHLMTIQREHLGRRGVGLRAVAALRPVDIGLRLDRGRLRCRDAGHSVAIAEATDDALAWHRPDEATDAGIRWRFADPGNEVGPLTDLARGLEVAVRRFVAARERLPAPQSVADLDPEFRQLARRLGATYEPAGMDLFGEREELDYSLQVLFPPGEDGARTIMLKASPLIPIDGRYRGRWVGGATGESSPTGLDQVVRDADGHSIDERAIRVFFPIRALSPTLLGNRLEALIAVARALSMRRPGYR